MFVYQCERLERRLQLAEISMVADNSTTASTPAPVAVQLGDVTLYTTATPEVGMELWVTRGTPETTQLVKDINPGPSSSFPLHIAVINGVGYFTANDGSHGSELWRTDGTDDGTWMVSDIRPGSSPSVPLNFVGLGSHVYFTTYKDASTRELWRTDGSDAGTVMVLNLSATNISGLTSINGRIVFVASSGSQSVYYSFDGVSAVQLPAPAVTSGTAIVRRADDVIITANTTGSEFWRTDGTVGGTVKLGVTGMSRTGNFTTVGSGYFFTGSLGLSGTELCYTTDFTSTGTLMVKDIYPGGNSSIPSYLTEINR
jgi:ELWxxDGT repeat protein